MPAPFGFSRRARAAGCIRFHSPVPFCVRTPRSAPLRITRAAVLALTAVALGTVGHVLVTGAVADGQRLALALALLAPGALWLTRRERSLPVIVGLLAIGQGITHLVSSVRIGGPGIDGLLSHALVCDISSGAPGSGGQASAGLVAAMIAAHVATTLACATWLLGAANGSPGASRPW